jgi:hypothetical protein
LFPYKGETSYLVVGACLLCQVRSVVCAAAIFVEFMQ